MGQRGAGCETDGNDCGGGLGGLKRASRSCRDFHGAHSDGNGSLKGTVASHGSLIPEETPWPLASWHSALAAVETSAELQNSPVCSTHPDVLI